MRRINPSVLRLGLTSNWRYNSKALNYIFLNRLFNHFDFFFKQKINNLQTSRVRWKIRRFHFRKKYWRRRLISYVIQSRSSYFLKKWFKNEKKDIFDKTKEIREPLTFFFNQPKFAFLKRLFVNTDAPRFVKKTFSKYRNFKKNNKKFNKKIVLNRKFRKTYFPLKLHKLLKLNNVNLKYFPSLVFNNQKNGSNSAVGGCFVKNATSQVELSSSSFFLAHRRFSTIAVKKHFRPVSNFKKKVSRFSKTGGLKNWGTKQKMISSKRLKINQFLSKLKSGAVLKPQDGWWTKKHLFKTYRKTFNFFSRFVSFRFPVQRASWRHFFYYFKMSGKLSKQLSSFHAPGIQPFFRFYKSKLNFKKSKVAFFPKKKTFFFNKPYKTHANKKTTLVLGKKNLGLRTVIFKRLKNFSALIRRRKAFKRSAFKVSNFSLGMRRRVVHVPVYFISRTKKTPRWSASIKKKKSFKKLKKISKNKKYFLPMKPWNFKRYRAHISFRFFRPIARRFKTTNAVEKLVESNLSNYPFSVSMRNAQLLLLNNLSFTRLVYQAPVYSKLGRFSSRVGKKKGWHRLALLLTAAFHWRNVALVVSVLGLEFRRTRFHYRFFKIFGKFLRLFLSNQIFFLNFVIRVRGCFGKIARTRSLFLRPLSKFHIPMLFSNYNYPVTFSFKHILTRRGVFSFAVWCV